MLVLSGKRIGNTLIGIFAILLILTFGINLNKSKNDYVETVSLPVSGKTIVIDAGHGVPDERSRGS